MSTFIQFKKIWIQLAPESALQFLYMHSQEMLKEELNSFRFNFSFQDKMITSVERRRKVFSFKFKTKCCGHFKG